MDDYVKYLKRKFNNRVYLYSKGPDRISLIIECDKEEKYKLDIFRSPPENYYSNLLYNCDV
jgi:hypothetical protein